MKKLPKSLYSALGPVPIGRAPKPLTLDGEPNDKAIGQYSYITRRITLRDDLDGDTLWAVLFHEWVHVILTDAGCQGMSEEHVEFVCDALGTALAAARREGRLVIR
jgi:hypothetical protein